MSVNKTALIVDAWAQPATKEAMEKLPEVVRLFKQSGSSSVMETGMTTEQIIESMDRAGIQKLMLSAWHRPGQWVYHNDDVAEMVSRYPDRFAGVAAVNLEKPVEAVRELERAGRRSAIKSPTNTQKPRAISG